jgi:pSer/pThr/pTyr-binding forkhead associated (FHA) protein
MAYIEVYFPNGRVEHFELSKASMTVGRSSEADIHIDDPIISRLHARMDKANRGRWAITDLDSRNKTYYNDQTIKSHPLINNDTFSLGSIKVVFHDPSGNSDEDTGRTIYETVQPEKQITEEQACPSCDAPMAEDAVVCTECGYNLKTGKNLKMAVEDDTDDTNGTTVTTVPKLKKKKTAATLPKNHIPVSKQWLIFKDWWMPLGLLALGILINFAALPPLKACATLMGMIFNTVLILFATAIATKLGGLEIENFGNAIVKILAIASILSIFGTLDDVLFILFTLAVLVGTIKFFFEPRMLEWFLIAGVVTVLDYFIVYRNTMPQLFQMVQEMSV